MNAINWDWLVLYGLMTAEEAKEMKEFERLKRKLKDPLFVRLALAKLTCFKRACAVEVTTRPPKIKNMAQHPLYGTWSGIKRRCTNPNSKSYKHYGGRGITVCKQWASSFEQFAHDMGEKPSPEHTLDRIDNELGYSPENCRWATVSEQNLNRRSVAEVQAKADEYAQEIERLRTLLKSFGVEA